MEIPAQNLAGSTDARIRVWVTDGTHTAADTSDEAFTVPNHPPTLTIRSPENATVWAVNQTVHLSADVYDVELGTAVGGLVRWSSDQEDGELSVTLSEPGVHTITAHMDDGQGGVTTDTVQITVLAAPQAPPEIFLPWVVR